jgi:hypothetical protein
MEIKASSLIITLQRLLKSQPIEIQHKFSALLHDELNDWFLQTNGVEWLSIKTFALFLDQAAPLFYPTEPNPVLRLAEENLGNPSDRFQSQLFKHVNEWWAITCFPYFFANFFRGGKIKAQKTELGLSVVFLGTPDLPRAIREYWSGHFNTMSKVIYGPGAKVILQEDDPDAWRWELCKSETPKNQ